MKTEMLFGGDLEAGGHMEPLSWGVMDRLSTADFTEEQFALVDRAIRDELEARFGKQGNA
jgi:hypothetical protein